MSMSGPDPSDGAPAEANSLNAWMTAQGSSFDALEATGLYSTRAPMMLNFQHMLKVRPDFKS